MSERVPPIARPQPREAFGHPVTTETRLPLLYEKPGFVASEAPAEAQSNGAIREQQNSVLPPRNTADIPRTSLSERIRERLASEELK
jgi:hypothetical protein